MKYCWKSSYFLSCTFWPYIVFWTLFPPFFFFFFISPVPIGVLSLGKSHRADLCSRIQGIGGSSLTLILAVIFWIWHQKQKQQKQTSTNGTTPNLEASIQQKKQQNKKKKHAEWEKAFANHISAKGLITKICKALIQLNNNKKNN